MSVVWTMFGVCHYGDRLLSLWWPTMFCVPADDHFLRLLHLRTDRRHSECAVCACGSEACRLHVVSADSVHLSGMLWNGRLHPQLLAHLSLGQCWAAAHVPRPGAFPPPLCRDDRKEQGRAQQQQMRFLWLALDGLMGHQEGHQEWHQVGHREGHQELLGGAQLSNNMSKQFRKIETVYWKWTWTLYLLYTDIISLDQNCMFAHSFHCIMGLQNRSWITACKRHPVICS